METTQSQRMFELYENMGGLLARGNNNAERAVQDHRQSAEDSFVHHRYWFPSVVTGEQKEHGTSHPKGV